MGRSKVCECGQKMYFLKTMKGYFIPVNAGSLNPKETEDLDNGMERLFVPGRHITHFSTCPNAKKFKK